MNKTIRKIVSMTLAIVMVLGTAMFTVDEQVYGLSFSTFTTGSPFSGVAYSTYYHNKDKFNGNIVLNGVDVSTYQSGSYSEWDKARNAGVDFSIMRVTWTGYTNSKHSYKNLDNNFANHYKRAKAAGELVGVYVFSQAKTTTEAKNEATFAVNRLKELGIKPGDLDLPIYMDYEFAGAGDGGRLYALKNSLGTSGFKKRTTECAKAFCEQIKALGYNPGIYACLDFLKNSTDGVALGKLYEIWCAQYWNACEFTGNYNMWQYSSSAKIAGIYKDGQKGTKSSTDVNYMYLNKNRTNSVSNDVTNCTVSGSTTVTYTGSQVEPTFTLKLGGKTLKSGTDYKIGYARNIKVGTGYAYIRGIGEYQGYKVIPFNIQKVVIENIGMGELKIMETTDPLEEPEAIVEGDQEIEKPEDITTEDGVKPIEEEGVSGETVEETAISPEPVFRGYAVGLTDIAQQIGYTLDDTELGGVVSGTTAAGLKKCLYFADGWEDCSFRITDPDGGAKIADGSAVKTGYLLDVYRDDKRIASAKIVVTGSVEITLSTTSYTYNGSVKKPNITVKYGNYVIASKITADNDDVDITYPSGRKLPGTYTVAVKSKTGIAGKAEADFKIKVKPTELKSVTNSSKQKIKAKWNKVGSKYITGYQIQYSRYSDMRLDLKKKATSYKTTSKTVKTNYRNKKYYVRIRTYKTISKKTYYSSWSKKMTLTVK